MISTLCFRDLADITVSVTINTLKYPKFQKSISCEMFLAFFDRFFSSSIAIFCFLNDVPLHVIQRQLGHETLQQTLDYIKDLISEQEGRKYLEEAVLFAKEPEQLQRNEHDITKDNVIEFRTKIAAKPHKQAH